MPVYFTAQTSRDNFHLDNLLSVDMTNSKSYLNKPLLVDGGYCTINNPDCMAGIREVYLIDSREATRHCLVKVIGVDSTNTFHIWLNRFYVNGWTGWQVK